MDDLPPLAPASADADGVVADGDRPGAPRATGPGDLLWARMRGPVSRFGAFLSGDEGQVLRGWLTFAVVLAATGLVVSQFRPTLLVSDSTPAGGDMGAHVWAPAYMRDVLIPSGRLTGWTHDWYAGFPAMQFYMVVPMLLIVLLDVVLPYGVAFKVVTVLGPATLPAAAYAFGRLSRLPFPGPALMSVAAAAFVFDRSYSIQGGNALSTLAGEFAFTISLSLALVYLGLVARGLQTGRHRAVAALLLGLTGLCHLIPAFFAVGGTLVWLLAYAGRDLYEAVGSVQEDRWRRLATASWSRLRWTATMAPVAALLGAFWVLPFYARQRYLNDMGWVKSENYFDLLFWRQNVGGGGLSNYPELAFLLALGILGVVVALGLRNRQAAFLIGTALVAMAAFRYVPQGRLWNTRLLPFYYLSLYLLAAVAVSQLPQVLARVRLRRGLGIGALLGTVGLHWMVVTQPASIPVWGEVTWAPADGSVDVTLWRFTPYVYVGIVVVALVAAAELAAFDLYRRRRAAWALVGGAVLLQAAMALGPDHWFTGARLLGYTLAVLALVAFSAVLEVVDIGRDAVTGERPGWAAESARLVGAAVAVGVVWLYLAIPLGALGPLGASENGEYGVRFLGFTQTTHRHMVAGWAKWNYSGYEGSEYVESQHRYNSKPYFPEYEAVIRTMEDVADRYGCGRAMWEYSSDLNTYGTPMALMLLPHWTDGCIGSMEGLYFEASTTTPYHFINQDELSEAGSNAQRGMPYGPGAPTVDDFDRGIRHLQMFGVRYYMSYTDLLTGYARDHPALTEIATSPAVCRPELCPASVTDPPDRWVIFLVADSELVAPLEFEPLVLEGVGDGHTCESAIGEPPGSLMVSLARTAGAVPRQRECQGWLEPAVQWYMEPDLWPVPLAESGPEAWERRGVDNWLVDSDVERRPVETVTVTDIEVGRQSLSFRVDQVGSPVLVKVSYFPNWQVRGADGPWRVSPNLMVVVPTDTDVELSYGWTGIDRFAYGLTALGIVLLFLLVRSQAVPMAPGPVAVWRAGAVTTTDERGGSASDAVGDGPSGPYAGVVGPPRPGPAGLPEPPGAPVAVDPDE